MSTSPNPVTPFSTASFVALVALLILSVILFIFLMQAVNIRRVKKLRIELNGARAERVSQALAGKEEISDSPKAESAKYPFAKWVELTPAGRIQIGAKSYSPGEVFEESIRDGRNLSRAKITGRPDGKIIIFSHGQVYLAAFNGQWDVAPMNSKDP
jgi:hypothetical protein